MTEQLSAEANRNLAQYRNKFIVAAELTQEKHKAMFSSIPYHSSPVSVNLISNAVLKQLSGSKDFWIETINEPLSSRFSAEVQTLPYDVMEYRYDTEEVPYLVAGIILIGLSLLTSSFLILPTQEKVTKVWNRLHAIIMSLHFQCIILY